MGRMTGMVAIVTGASRGLGRAIAKEYAREGASVVLSARSRSPTGLPGTIHETARDIEAEGGRAFPVPCDVSDNDQVEEMVQKVLDRYGKIDVLVNNAGIMIIGEPFLDIDPDRFDQLMAANVRGPYLTCRHVVPIMMEQRRGSILNIGSRMGVQHGAVSLVYGASKAALHMFSFSLADELREYNIAVNVLSPGSRRSEGSAAIPWAQSDWHERIEPALVGSSAVWLALQDAGSFTGRLVLRSEFGTTWGL